MNKRTMAAALVVSLLVGGVCSAQTADVVTPDQWQAEATHNLPGNRWSAESAAVARMTKVIDSDTTASVDADTSQATSDTTATPTVSANAEVTKQGLAQVGKTFTAAVLSPLSDKDFTLNHLTIGHVLTGERPVHAFPVSDSASTQITPEAMPIQGVFQTFSGADGSYTLYVGPTDTSAPGTPDADRKLRFQGMPYHYTTNTVTDIHVVGGRYNTARNIGIGNTRGEVLFAYGAPAAMWKKAGSDELVMLYASPSINRNIVTQPDFISADVQAKDPVEGMSKDARFSTQSDIASAPNKRYLAFTLTANKVKTIDYIDGAVWPGLGLPNAPLHHLVPNRLSDGDFALMGYRLNDKFDGNQDERWETKGTLYGGKFLAYKDVIVGYDNKNLISRVLIGRSTAVTRRGISIGDTKYLLLYMYGMPTSTETDVGKDGTAYTVYTYKNPKEENSYLLFTVGDKDGFIKNVMLSDRPYKELNKDDVVH